VRIITDTNLLVRFFVDSEKETEHRKIAVHFMDEADEIIIPTHVVCELVWVLSKGYKFKLDALHLALLDFLQRDKLVTQEDEIAAGMEFLEKGGDFADGVNAYTGRNMAHGRAVFVSFDEQAVKILTERGIAAMIPRL
jgi:predicted nucleic-acid-binding protein